MLGTKQRTQFKEILGAAVYISNTHANYANSMALLQQNGLRPMTYQEALVLISGNPKLKHKLEDKWFYLGGEKLDESGFYTFDNTGNLVKGKGSPEQTVYLWSGTGPLSLDVHVDDVINGAERRFDLDAAIGPDLISPRIVGVKIGFKLATPKIRASAEAKLETAKSALRA